jgi:hypothetical protein
LNIGVKPGLSLRSSQPLISSQRLASRMSLGSIPHSLAWVSTEGNALPRLPGSPLAWSHKLAYTKTVPFLALQSASSMDGTSENPVLAMTGRLSAVVM